METKHVSKRPTRKELMDYALAHARVILSQAERLVKETEQDEVKSALIKNVPDIVMMMFGSLTEYSSKIKQANYFPKK